MDFNDNKPIYLQISDVVCEKILSGTWQEGQRIPSVREYGAEVGVNPNTVMRTYEKLTAEGVIFNKRGIGYFVSPDAVQTVRQNRRRDFMDNELPLLVRKLKLLGIEPSELLDRLS